MFTKRYKYKDINLSFDKHPLTGDILIATDVDAIKKALRNLVLTNVFEAPFDPNKGSGIREMLFENFSPMTSEFLKRKIMELVERYEPRVGIKKVLMIQRDDQNSIEISIYFAIKNLQLEEKFTIFVERTR